MATDKGDISAFVGDYNQKGDRKEYKGDELYTIGMPVGGICAGQLYVRGDGTLANWWIANNAYNTGYGIDHLLNFDTPLGLGRSATRLLSLRVISTKDSQSKLPAKAIDGRKI